MLKVHGWQGGNGLGDIHVHHVHGPVEHSYHVPYLDVGIPTFLCNNYKERKALMLLLLFCFCSYTELESTSRKCRRGLQLSRWEARLILRQSSIDNKKVLFPTQYHLLASVDGPTCEHMWWGRSNTSDDWWCPSQKDAYVICIVVGLFGNSINSGFSLDLDKRDGRK